MEISILTDTTAVDTNGNIKQSLGNAKKTKTFPGFGILCTLISGVFFSLSSLITKLTTLAPIQMAASRCFVQFLLLLPIVTFMNKKFDIIGPRGLIKFLWLRGLLGSTTMILLYCAIGELSLGNAVTLQFLSTVLVGFVARCFLKESLTITDGVFAIVSLTGVVLIAQPPFLFPTNDSKPQSTLGIVYGLLSATVVSFTLVSIRKLGKETHFLLSVLYYSFIGSISSTILLIATQQFRLPCLHELPYLLSVGICGVMGQSFLVLALQRERAGTVSVLRTAQIFIIYTMQVRW